MHKSESWLICLALLSSCGTVLTGCSLIGYGIGSSVDPGQYGTQIQISDGVDGLSLNTKVIIVKNNSAKIKGHFKGMSPPADTVACVNYGEEFERWRTQPAHESFQIPSFGSKVQIVMNVAGSTMSTLGRFGGFGPGTIRFITGVHGETTEYDMSSVKEVHDTLGQIITADILAQALASGLPLAGRQVQCKPATAILVARYSSPSFTQLDSIPLAEVQGVYLWESTRARWDGLIIGATIDVAVVVAAIIAYDNFEISFSH